MPQLTWLGDAQSKHAARRVPYRLLETQAVHGDPTAGNWLIQGDNLDALKALLPFCAGRVKCIFIDPPYNTRSAFTHYDDNLEHGQWLAMMYPRLELLRDLLAEDGSIWVTIDDNEAHYLKVIMDEVFGRANFVANVVWEKSDSPKMDSQLFSSRHDHLLVFAKNIGAFSLHRLHDEGDTAHYNKVDENNRRYYTKPLRAMGSGDDTREARPSLFFGITAPDGTEVFPRKPDGTDGRWRWSAEKIAAEADRIEWVKGKKGWTIYYRIFAELSQGRPPETIWSHKEVGSNRTSKAQAKSLFDEETTFTTPKPEGVIQQALRIATNANDLVLDSFLGSGTTAAVAHKMGRRWIGIEMGEHARTHCLPRMLKVIDGEQGGISQSVGWQGGGGFRFMHLGEPVFAADGSINPAVRFATLAGYLWFLETGTPWANTPCTAGDGERTPVLPYSRTAEPAYSRTALLGIHADTAYVLLYNGVLGDRHPDQGNVLTSPLWREIEPLAGGRAAHWVIYGEAALIPESRRRALGITFKQIPYDIRMR